MGPRFTVTPVSDTQLLALRRGMMIGWIFTIGLCVWVLWTVEWFWPSV